MHNLIRTRCVPVAVTPPANNRQPTELTPRWDWLWFVPHAQYALNLAPGLRVISLGYTTHTQIQIQIQTQSKIQFQTRIQTWSRSPRRVVHLSDRDSWTIRERKSERERWGERKTELNALRVAASCIRACKSQPDDDQNAAAYRLPNRKWRAGREL